MTGVSITSYTWHQDVIEFDSSLEVSDPRWRYTDAAGHVHSALSDSWTTERGEEAWCSSCCDFHGEIGSWCTECGEELHPSTVPMGAAFIPGLQSITVEGVAEEMQLGQTFELDLEDIGPCKVLVTEIEWSNTVVRFSGHATPIRQVSK